MCVGVALIAGGCDGDAERQGDPTDEAPAALPTELSERALARASEEERLALPDETVWTGAIEGLAPTATEDCPEEALRAPREGSMVAVRAQRFSTDLRQDVVPIVLGRYGRVHPRIAYADGLRAAVENREAERVRELLAQTVTVPEPRAVVVVSVEGLTTPQREGEGHFRSGRLTGRAYLLVPPDHAVACSMPLDAQNSGLIVADRFAGVSMFDATAIFELFEIAERAIHARWGEGPAAAVRAAPEPAAP